ncbi:MAG: proline--tRNA ligase [Myxococcota bacterium]|nr:proline--tRNA ligase [Myxococcota bacterium]
MRWSRAFIPTLRDDPADSEAVSHRLLLRAGFMRQLGAGLWSLLPLGLRVVARIERIVHQEMCAIGAQEFFLPTLHPAELWRQSGRWDSIDETLFRLRDRKRSEMCLAMTHEEVFTAIARDEIRSYRDLPQIWYQIQNKFRDEPRPKAGLLRGREFKMKDSYSFDLDWEGLDRSFEIHAAAYAKIFERVGIEAFQVEASSGAMGGSESCEFMSYSEAGEDWVVSCSGCDYAANLEKANSALAPSGEPGSPDLPEKFPTPGIRTIEALEQFPGGAPASQQIKTLVYFGGDGPLLLLVRGDDELNEVKAIDSTGDTGLRPATDQEIRDALGASAGSLGAVAVTDLPVYVDEVLRGRSGMTTGANEDGFHLRSVDVERDLAEIRWADLRTVREGEPCVECGKALEVRKAIEVAHIFKLGLYYSESMGATVLGREGKEVPIVMGSYGIGITRLVAAVAEACHDELGLVWPVSVAPFDVIVTPVRIKDEAQSRAAEELYSALREAGLEVLLDDRDERPGVKFKDADLIGVPLRLTIGPRSLAKGMVELQERNTTEGSEIPLEAAVTEVRRRVQR